VPNIEGREHTAGCTSLTNVVKEVFKRGLIGGGEGTTVSLPTVQFNFNACSPWRNASTHKQRRAKDDEVLWQDPVLESESATGKNG
jgi:hypothetical protein